MHRTKILALMASIGFTLIIGPVLSAVALAADPVVVRPGETLTSIAKRHGVGISDLVTWNRISDPNRIYAGQRLRVEPEGQPTGGSAPAPAPAAPAAPAPVAQPAEQNVHTVGRGESLWAIARRYGTSVSAIAAHNAITNAGRIHTGQRLVIPGTTPPPAPAAPAPAAPAVPAAPATPVAAAQPVEQTIHTVARGESLWTIARRYGTSVGALASTNGIGDPSRIFAGQRLTIPGASTTPPAPAAGRAGVTMPASMARLVAERDAVRQVILQEAANFSVPAAFALAVAWQESGWQQGVVSSAGAVGVMQLMPATTEWVAQAMLGSPVDPGDLRQNVRAGVRLLAHYLDRYDGNRDLVLAAYYQGQRAADRHGVYAVSRPYIASIGVLEAIFSQ